MRYLYGLKNLQLFLKVSKELVARIGICHGSIPPTLEYVAGAAQTHSSFD